MKNFISCVFGLLILLAFAVYALCSPAARQDLEEINNGKNDIF